MSINCKQSFKPSSSLRRGLYLETCTWATMDFLESSTSRSRISNDSGNLFNFDRTVSQSVGRTNRPKLGIEESELCGWRKKLKWACSTSNQCVFTSTHHVISESSGKFCNKDVEDCCDCDDDSEESRKESSCLCSLCIPWLVAFTASGTVAFASLSSRSANKWIIPSFRGIKTCHISTPTRMSDAPRKVRRKHGGVLVLWSSGFCASAMDCFRKSLKRPTCSGTNRRSKFLPLKLPCVISKCFKQSVSRQTVMSSVSTTSPSLAARSQWWWGFANRRHAETGYHWLGVQKIPEALICEKWPRTQGRKKMQWY